MILYNSESNIRDIWQFCRALSFVTAVLWSMLQLSYSSAAVELWLPIITEIPPPNLTGWIRPWSHSHEQSIFQTCGSTATDSLLLFFAQYKCTRLTAISSHVSLHCFPSMRSTAKQNACCYRNMQKTPVTVIWSEPLRICCFAIVTQ